VFGSFTGDLLVLADWLREQGVTHVAMEATGVYWRPVWAVLEGQFEQLLVNPQHIKAVPGRKTDAIALVEDGFFLTKSRMNSIALLHQFGKCFRLDGQKHFSHFRGDAI
jgi:hypothetical protein